MTKSRNQDDSSVDKWWQGNASLPFAGRFHSPVQSLDTDDDGSPVHAGSSHWSGAHSNVGMHCTDPKKKDKGKGQFADEVLGGWRAQLLLAFNVTSLLWQKWWRICDFWYYFVIWKYSIVCRRKNNWSLHLKTAASDWKVKNGPKCFVVGFFSLLLCISSCR